MEHVLWRKKNKTRLKMKSIFTFILIPLFIILPFSLLFAEKNIEESNIIEHDVSIGIGGVFGLYGVHKRRGSATWSQGIGYGGSLIFEKMFSNIFGIHSGIWFSHYEVGIAFPEDPTEIEWRAKSISIPFYLITSINGSKIVSINFLTGFNITQFIQTKIFTDDPASLNSSADVLKDIGYVQVGIAGGINLKFRIGKFTDFYIGGIAEMYITNLMPKNDDDIYHSYDFRGISGIMFRTNLFPKPDKK